MLVIWHIDLKMKKIVIFILSFSLFISACRCKNVGDNNWIIDLPETKNPININQWAIIKYSSIKLRLKPIAKSKILSYMPVGTIVEVLKKENQLKTFYNTKDYWYYIDCYGEKGWVFGSFIEVFNNYEEAEKECEKLILEKAREKRDLDIK